MIKNYGTINCYGYIKQSYADIHDDDGEIINASGKSHGSEIVNYENSETSLPLVIYDWKGGTNSLAYNSAKVFPFTIFDFPNIQTLMTFNVGSKLLSATRFYMSSSTQKTEKIGIIGGSNSSSLFKLSEGSISFKYVPTNNLITTDDASYNSTIFNKTYISVRGNLNLSSLDVKMTLMITIKSSNFDLPFSYKFNFRVFEGEVNLEEKVKFLRGSRVKVEPNATINVNSSAIFYQNVFEAYYHTGTSTYYPKVFSHENLANVANFDSTKYAAKMINNGKIIVQGSLAGKVETTSEDATLQFIKGSSNTVSLKERVTVIKGLNDKGEEVDSEIWGTITGSAFGLFESTDVLKKFVSSPDETKTYESSSLNEIYYWSGDQGDDYDGVETIERTFPSSSGGGCLAVDTNVLMADGTYKMVGDIRAGDLLTVFNHETGELDIAPVIFNDDVDSGAEITDVVYLTFSNGKTIKLTYEHGFFDLDTMMYEYITASNYENFIGDRFVGVDNEIIGEVTLVDAYVVHELVEYCSPVTYYHLNLITEGILSMPGGISGLFNIFEYDENLQYNAAKKTADIERYGLYTYDDFSDLVPYDFYAAFPTPYLKVAVGKGLISEEDIKYLIDRYLPIATE